MNPPAAVVCCVREAVEPEGAGHDVDCPGPGVIGSNAQRRGEQQSRSGTSRRCAPTLGRHVYPHRRCPEMGAS